MACSRIHHKPLNAVETGKVVVAVVCEVQRGSQTTGWGRDEKEEN